MPKEGRKRTSLHAPSARPAKRQFAVQDNAVTELVVPGEEAETSANALLQSMTEPEEPPIQLKKKEKQTLKRELFLQRLESSQAPYSKSHARRMRRKAAQQIGTGLADMQSALADLEEDVPEAVKLTHAEDDDPSVDETNKKPQTRRGMIGEGKGVPLSKSQRKRELQTEKMRIPIIMKNADFKANPFAAIRKHAQNTLIKHDPSA